MLAFGSGKHHFTLTCGTSYGDLGNVNFGTIISSPGRKTALKIHTPLRLNLRSGNE
jgi:hypothetical protein